MADAPMTKAQAREYLKRIREAVRDAEIAITKGYKQILVEDMQEIAGCAGTIETALVDDYIGEGIRGVS